MRVLLLALLLTVLPGLAVATSTPTYGASCDGPEGECPGDQECLEDPTSDPELRVTQYRCLARCETVADCKGQVPDPGCGGRPTACFEGVCI